MGLIALVLTVHVTFSSQAHAETPSIAAAKKLGNSASGSAGPAKAKGAPQQYSAEELELVRSKLLDMVDAVKEFTQLFPSNADNIRNLEAARAHFQQASQKELSAYRDAFDPATMNPGLADARAVIADFKQNAAKSSGAIEARHKSKGGLTPSAIADGPFPPRPDPGDPICNGLFGNNRPSATVILTADIVFLAAEIVRDVAQDICKQDVLGENTSLACEITDGVYNVAKIVREKIRDCDDDFTKRTVDANFDRLDDVHTDLLAAVTNDDTNTASIISAISSTTTTIAGDITTATNTIVSNDNTNTANIIANDNTNTLSIINNDNTNTLKIIGQLQTVGCEVIRLLNTPMGLRSSNIASCVGQPGFPYQFNHNAGTSAVAPSSSRVVTDVQNPGSTPVSRGQDGVPVLPLVGTVTMEIHLLEGRLIPTYYLPAAKGGMIEQVQLLVWNTINSQAELQIAKDRTEQARQLASQADQLLNQKKYVEAYRQYSLAYQTLVPVL
jgi:hypothetical protein